MDSFTPTTSGSPDPTAALIDEITRLCTELEHLRKALDAIEAAAHASMYERCPDCDWPDVCSRETGCKSVPNPAPIAREALTRGG